MKTDPRQSRNYPHWSAAVLLMAAILPLAGCQQSDIFEAARNGNTKRLAKLLTKDEGSLYSRDSVGRTPLHLAALEGRDDTIQFLLEKGMDPGATDRIGYSAIDYARLSGTDKTVELLEENGSLQDAVRSGDLALIRKIIVRNPDSVDQVGSDGGVPLHSALRNQDNAAIELLLREGASPNVPLGGGESPLQFAIRHSSTRIAILLLESGADPNFLDSRGRSPLYLAIQNQDHDMVKSLLEHGANAEIRMAEGLTPIQIAAQIGHIGIVEELIRGGASIDSKNDNGRDVLYWAQKHHHYKLAHLIGDMIKIDDD